MTAEYLPVVGAFGLTTVLTLVVLFWSEKGERTRQRLQSLAPKQAAPLSAPATPGPKLRPPGPTNNLLVPDAEKERTQLKSRLLAAGFYRPQAMHWFLVAKLVAMLVPVAAGAAVGLLSLAPLWAAVRAGTLASSIGLVGPSMWLARQGKIRQRQLRRALPDTLDVIVICLDGGLSLQAALNRVVKELGPAFPELAMEIRIALREAQLGMSIGEALRRFGDRADLEEVRALAAIVIQSERYGASLGKALRTHAESMRVKRLQLAEELGQKASVKIIFPTILLILPAFFVVVLGPALLRMEHIFGNKH